VRGIALRIPALEKSSRNGSSLMETAMRRGGSISAGVAPVACAFLLLAANAGQARAEESTVLLCTWQDGETDTYTLNLASKTVNSVHTHPNPGGSPDPVISSADGAITRISDDTIEFGFGYLNLSLNRYTLEIIARESGWLGHCQKEQRQL